MKNKKYFWLIFNLIILFLSVTGLIIFLLWYISKDSDIDIIPRISPTPTQSSDDDTRRYYYTRIIIFGQDALGSDVLFKMQMSRLEQDDKSYKHAYSVTRMIDSKSIIKDNVFMSPDYQISTDKLITKADIKYFEDTSPREEYNLTLNIDSESYNISITELEGDFIVKRTNDYYRMVSPGKAYIEGIGELNVMVDQIFSNDEKAIFEEGEEPSYQTHSIVLWDEEDNFYLIDKTNVTNKTNSYVSHTWILNKNNDGTIQKAFDSDFQFLKSKNNLPQSWDIFVKDMKNTRISLQRLASLRQNQNSGIVKGVVEKDNIQIPISGYFIYIENNP